MDHELLRQDAMYETKLRISYYLCFVFSVLELGFYGDQRDTFRSDANGTAATKCVCTNHDFTEKSISASRRLIFSTFQSQHH